MGFFSSESLVNYWRYFFIRIFLGWLLKFSIQIKKQILICLIIAFYKIYLLLKIVIAKAYK